MAFDDRDGPPQEAAGRRTDPAHAVAGDSTRSRGHRGRAKLGDAIDAPGAVLIQPPDPAEISRHLVELRLEHRDLDVAIDRMASGLVGDELQLRRLKKRKLLLKDAIAKLESRLIPDLDA